MRRPDERWWRLDARAYFLGFGSQNAAQVTRPRGSQSWEWWAYGKEHGTADNRLDAMLAAEEAVSA